MSNRTVVVEVIEETPKTLSQFAIDNSGTPAREVGLAYGQYLERFQPFRLLVKVAGNNEALFRSTERYFNRADAEHAAEVGFGAGSTVVLRRDGDEDQVIRAAEPS